MKPDRRHLKFILAITGLALAALACNFGVEQETPAIRLSPTISPPAPTSTPEQDTGGVEAAATATDVIVTDCTEADPHPIGQSIASTYDVMYEQVMAWFCGGNTFDDILIALETSTDVDVPVESLLEMRRQDKSWEEIWKDIGYIDQS